MPSQLGNILLLLALLVVSFYILLPNPQHSSASPPQPAEPSTPSVNATYERRIIAVGDLHGDLPNALEVLRMSGVIDDKEHWTGYADYFVQTGDIVDRGDDTIALYALMDDLRSQARKVGGDVLSHLGNHEYMNAIGDWRYVPDNEIKTFGSVSERQKSISTGVIGKTWRSNYTVTSRLPLHPSLGAPNTDYDPSAPSSALSHAALSFLHGGVSPTFPYNTPYPSRINDLGRSLLRKLQSRPQPPPYPKNGPYPGLPDSATQAEQELYGTDGPLWYRGWAQDSEEDVCAKVDGLMEKIGVRRLIMGHTPTFDHIVDRCGGKIIIIDTGISHAYGGILSALEIHYTLTPIASGSEATLASGARKATAAKAMSYIEREVITAIYPGHRVELVRDEGEISGHL